MGCGVGVGARPYPPQDRGVDRQPNERGTYCNPEPQIARGLFRQVLLSYLLHKTFFSKTQHINDFQHGVLGPSHVGCGISVGARPYRPQDRGVGRQPNEPGTHCNPEPQITRGLFRQAMVSYLLHKTFFCFFKHSAHRGISTRRTRHKPRGMWDRCRCTPIPTPRSWGW